MPRRPTPRWPSWSVRAPSTTSATRVCFAEDRRRLDGWGSDRIAARLAEFGVPGHVIEAELGAREHGDELAGALEVLRGRLTSPPGSERERERALGLLVRRGYPLETAYDAVRAFERG